MVRGTERIVGLAPFKIATSPHPVSTEIAKSCQRGWIDAQRRSGVALLSCHRRNRGAVVRARSEGSYLRARVGKDMTPASADLARLCVYTQPSCCEKIPRERFAKLGR